VQGAFVDVSKVEPHPANYAKCKIFVTDRVDALEEIATHYTASRADLEDFDIAQMDGCQASEPGMYVEARSGLTKIIGQIADNFEFFDNGCSSGQVFNLVKQQLQGGAAKTTPGVHH
jgi:hypothetical protein